MKTKYICLLYSFILSIVACSEHHVIEIQNEKQGQLKATVILKEVAVKKFKLDSITAPKARYSQMYTDSNGVRNFTFLNTIDKSIYFYDYEKATFLKKLNLKKGLI